MQLSFRTASTAPGLAAQPRTCTFVKDFFVSDGRVLLQGVGGTLRFSVESGRRSLDAPCIARACPNLQCRFQILLSGVRIGPWVLATQKVQPQSLKLMSQSPAT